MQDHILVVDDDRQETSFLERFFRKNGYEATGVYTAGEMFDYLEKGTADLVVLDLILPDEDGLEAARKLQRNNDIPIIMLSARDEVFDKVVGLELGADDYVTKPYEPRELLARVRSVLRRYKRGNGELHDALPVIETGDIVIDFTAQRVSTRSPGKDLKLTHTEFELLQAIAVKRGDVVSRYDLVAQVYGENATVTDRAIDAHIVRLRRKLAGARGGVDLIATAHGAGYRFVMPANATN